MSKRILSLVLALVMVLGTFGTVFAAEPTENDKVNWLIDQGIVEGNEKGDYNLSGNIDRASVAKLVTFAVSSKAVADGMMLIPTGYKDANVSPWANGYIHVVTGQGLMIGNNGFFNPKGEITFEELATLFTRVALGRDLTAAEKGAGHWATPYIVKANELGIFDGVEVVNYKAQAKREQVFEMLYNALAHKEMGGYTVLKGIVLENYRVETLDKDEVVVEIIREIQKADYAEESRIEAGDQEKFVIPAKLGDVENLLGKVVDLTLDAKGKVVKVTVDNSYDYITGSFEVTRNKLGKYTVELDERYAGKDERVFRTYYNNDSYAYIDFYNEVEEVEYARITVKNGKILFIDAFDFEDVAPVAEDIDSKDKVAFYDDENGGDINDLEVDEDAYVILFADGETKLGDYSEIAKNDVIHWFEDRDENLTVFVRPAEDNMVKGEYVEANAARAKDAAGIKILVDDKEYPADIDSINRNPVYSTSASELTFLTLTDNYAVELADFEKEEVTLLLDMSGKVQLIGSETIDAGFYAIVTDNYNYDFKLLKADGTNEWYDTDRSTKISGTGTKEQRLNAIVKDSLVKATASEDLITEISLMTPEATLNGKINKINSSVVAFDSGDYSYVSKNAIVFVISGTTRKAMDLKTFLKDYYDPADTKYVEADHQILGYVIEGSKNVASVIVIEEAVSVVDKTELVAKVARSYFSGGDYWLNVTNSAGETTRHKTTKTIAESVYAKTGNIVALTVTKDDAKEITALELPAYEAEQVKVINYGELSRTERFVVLEDDTTIWLAPDADVFGSYRVGSYVSYRLDDATYKIADVLVVVSSPSSGGGVVPADGKLEAVYTRTNTLLIDGVLYEYAGDVSDLSRLVGKGITFDTSTDVNSKVFVYNVRLAK